MTNNNNNNIDDIRWKLLDKERFQSFFDSDGRLVKEHEFRKAVFKGESSSCRNLECLNISWCMNITENGIRILAESYPKLTNFKAEGCTQTLLYIQQIVTFY
ncbi:unnamed protein product [Rotaria sordida]|uniref:Uncharacterized protein n=1 Tax=Rotaria sordida TaxID=392033 RepID=A0A818SP05_9BILA|nr:unnamed protein product [Rotaria sordida]